MLAAKDSDAKVGNKVRREDPEKYKKKSNPACVQHARDMTGKLEYGRH